jgi:hypothetical protein
MSATLLLDSSKATHGSSDIDILSDTLDSSCLMEVSSYDAFSEGLSGLIKYSPKNSPDDIPICTTGQDWHLLGLHDIFQLTPDFTGFPHQFRMQEVLHAPAVIVPDHQHRSIALVTHPLLFH